MNARSGWRGFEIFPAYALAPRSPLTSNTDLMREALRAARRSCGPATRTLAETSKGPGFQQGALAA